jgi:predicted NBD/HSP70 family sugar kinase
MSTPPGSPNHAPRSILAIDIGGSKVKFLASGHTEPRRTPSGRRMTPQRMVETITELAKDWEYESISIGYPGLVGDSGPQSEPRNLGPGWVGFNFAAAFGKPVRILNDASMQALGSYEGGRMLFLGLGTGLGSTLIAENVIVPLELGQLRYRRNRTLGEVLGRSGLKRVGSRTWRRAVAEAVASLTDAFIADYVVIGGGNAKKLKTLPPGARLGNNLTAFRGGFRLWNLDDVRTQSADEHAPPVPAPAPAHIEWRLI